MSAQTRRGSARVRLDRALAGVYFLFTCVVGRPVVYIAAAPIASGGDPVRADASVRARDEPATFRLRERLMTAAFGVALVVESMLRVWIVYHWSAAHVPGRISSGFGGPTRLPHHCGQYTVLNLTGPRFPETCASLAVKVLLSGVYGPDRLTAAAVAPTLTAAT